MMIIRFAFESLQTESTVEEVNVKSSRYIVIPQVCYKLFGVYRITWLQNHEITDKKLESLVAHHPCR